ncbi:MAG TPA: endonuclease/exonuclease/phosphatase family protein [Chitinophaga sp.]|uniref:endonuclease/exonuclease/phosphatase family protein n=1 Tax=Chitinophaga sp. TaxID=1869181 RepID=UPI002DB82AF9|nr:endonuclease/exonuclease/phosphatase family protein [Chitinophaga sp.]HEU4554297.1 endonuclease/exonuclease/phosphatase family protein [Chitinophaga sp.]
MKRFQLLLPRLLLCINCLLNVGLLTSAWLPHLSPHQWWPSGFVGLLFPPLLAANLVFIPFWIICKKWYYWLSAGTVILSYNAVLVSFSLHWPQQWALERPQPPRFTVMTFNTSSMGLKGYKLDEEMHTSIFRTVREASPDILCLQEFYTNDDPNLTNNIAGIQHHLGYPHYFFTSDKTQWNTWHYGIVVFSRYPVLHARKIPCGYYSEAGSGSSILEADMLIYGDTVRVYTAQLRSYMFNPAELAQLQAIKKLDGNHTRFSGARGLVYKMRHTFTARAHQAELLHKLAKESPYPAIVCGDMNDTPVSYTYYTVSRQMQDAFLEKGSGIGRTLSFLSPTLRIDYILAQSYFNIHSYQTFRNATFEHFPVMASFSLKK